MRRYGKSSYGYGWFISAAADGRPIVRHGGALPCTASTLMRLPDGVVIAVLFNLGKTPKGQWLGRSLTSPLIERATGIKQWPDHDLTKLAPPSK